MSATWQSRFIHIKIYFNKLALKLSSRLTKLRLEAFNRYKGQAVFKST
jgi:hypothetical protein